MNDLDDDEPQPRRKRGCFKSCFLGLLGILVVLTLLIWGGRAALRKQGERQLQIVTRQLDADEPGWTLEAIEAERVRKFPPPESSSAPVILEIADAIPKEYAKWQPEDGGEWIGAAGNRLPPEKHVEAMKAVAESTRALRTKAQRLRDLAPGGFVVKHLDNPFATLLPHLQKTRDVLSLVQYDALLAALDKNPDAALRDALIAINLARAIGEEPTLISQLVRLACGRIAAQMTMQTLAWGEPKAGLPELQAALWAEAEEPKFLYGVRGERAGLHRLFAGLESGKLTTNDLMMMFDNNAPTFWQAGGLRLYKAMLPGDHAEALRILSEYVAAAKLPPHEQFAAMKRVQLPPRPPQSFRYLITSLMLPACDRVCEATIRSRAELYAASVAIACERFRQKTGTWPKSLADIPKDILPSVPADPYTGEPMRTQAMPDGLAVYSIGPELRPHDRKTGPLPGGDGLGWRLYDPDKRRLPPLPEPKKADPPDEEPKDP